MIYKIAVIGATGNVGRAIISILFELGLKKNQIIAVASESSINVKIPFGSAEYLKVQCIKDLDFKKISIVISALSSNVAKRIIPEISKNCIVIDNSSAFRMDKEIPLIVPEVNIEVIRNYKGKIISSPNCIAIPITVVLKPLIKLSGIKRIVLSTYQSTSGAGKKAMDELFNQTKSLYDGKIEQEKKRIAFNVIPKIGEVLSDGYTSEEEKIINEVKKILNYNIKVAVTSVRVPVFIGHAISAAIEFNSKVCINDIRNILKEAKGISYIESDVVTPIECAGKNNVYVSRLRVDDTVDFGVMMWIVSDNLRKGAALNTIQIAKKYFKPLVLEG